MRIVCTYFRVLFWIIAGFLPFSTLGQSVYHVSLKEDIGPNAWRTMEKAYNKAIDLQSDYFLLELNTYGGAVNFADSIRTQVLESEMPTIVYINRNAASAGTLISLASDFI